MIQVKKAPRVAALLCGLTICLSSCAGISQEQYNAVVAERDAAIAEKSSVDNELLIVSAERKTAISERASVKIQLTEVQGDLSEKEEQIAALSSQLEELEALYQKYQDLSDSEVLALTEANNLKAEEDRLAVEALRAEEAAKAAAEKAAKEAEAEAKARQGYDTGITYEQLARTPDNYLERKVKFYGKVIQVMELETEIQLRIAVNGDYNSVVYVYYKPSIVSSRVLVDDYITIYGVSKGLHTYQSTSGGPITIPMISVEKIDQ